MPENVKHNLTQQSNRLLERIRGLRRLEEMKRTEPVSSPRFHQLAEDVTDESRRIMFDAANEESLGNDSSAGDESIDDIDELHENRAG